MSSRLALFYAHVDPQKDTNTHALRRRALDEKCMLVPIELQSIYAFSQRQLLSVF